MLPGSFLGPWQDPLSRFTRYAREYGDVVYFRPGAERMVLVSHPADIHDVLVTHQANFTKSRGLERAKALLGEGLLTAEGAAHRRERRLLQPAFHQDRIARYASAMVESADRAQSRWQEREPFDVSREMMRLALAIVGRTLFDVDVEGQAEEIGRALTRVLETFWIGLLPFAAIIERLPVPAIQDAHRARAELDAIIYEIIAARRAEGSDRGDVLSMLLAAQDVEDGGDGRKLSDTQVRDEVMTLMLAGHETTANALTWTWYLLSQTPAVRDTLHEELDRVLGGRLPNATDVQALPYVERVVAEALRLYPPAWLIGRRSVGPYTIRGYTMPPRTIVIMSPYVVQRDARWFPDPARFWPERWTSEFAAALPRQAYFPFGAGARRCIGESFAWMELILLVATIAQRWDLSLVAGHQVVTQPLITLRAKYGMKMEARRREGNGEMGNGVMGR
jgi:cytochrome P450